MRKKMQQEDVTKKCVTSVRNGKGLREVDSKALFPNLNLKYEVVSNQ